MIRHLMAATALLATSALAAPADTVLLHGRIITADAKDSVVQALAISGGKIAAVGSDASISALIGPKTKVIDLKGRAATPGLIDTHAHILSTGLGELNQIALGGARSVEDMVAAVKARVATTPKGQWVLGVGWDEGKFADGRYPTAAELDAVSPDNPVWLENTTGHYGVANGLALKMAGVTATTATPTAGTIEKLPDGRPAGVMKETAQEPITRLIPEPTVAQRQAALSHMIRRLHEEGMTGFKDPSIGRADWQAYLGLAKAGNFPINACVLFSGGRSMATATKALAEIRQAKTEIAPVANSSLSVCGVKLFMDGSGAAPTAWMYEDWNHHRTEIAKGNSGYPQIDPAEYHQMITMFINADIGIGTHAIGDKAIDWVVDGYAAALKARPVKDLRLSIIHTNTPTDHAIATMAALQRDYGSGYPETQATFTWWIGDIYAANLGPARSQRLNPYATYLKNGILWGGGSDTGVTPFPARLGLWASTARETSGKVWGDAPFGTAESVDIHTALKSYTSWAAPLIRADGSGTLAVGKAADIAVWDRDPYSVPTAAIKDMKADITLFRGQVVFERKP
ncbi:amidohydrolase [Sandarakinorhabdus limnophila]|uniref:amidohydrolase n=1 Tax=Sandarakinorhabdus limnophila TaxID=210512 RepID=UPI0026F0E8C1|nr:amidohydrolase [Sandarakinorhabdus limnophila]